MAFRTTRNRTWSAAQAARSRAEAWRAEAGIMRTALVLIGDTTHDLHVAQHLGIDFILV